MFLSLAICTYRRNALLEACLQSCFAQTGAALDACEIVVVDNCPDKTAAPVVARMAAAAPAAGPSLRYVHEPRTSLSHARNAAVDAARGALIAFIDDDNTLPPNWIATVRRLFDAATDEDPVACVFGDVTPVFAPEADPAAVAALTPLLQRHVKADADGVVTPRSSGHIEGGRMNHSILRKAVCFPPDERPWFDTAYGVSGGEDTDYFIRLARRVGPRAFRSSSELLITEYFPLERASIDWALRRAFCEAQIYAHTQVKNSAWPGLRALDIAVRGGLQTCAGAGLAAFCRAVGRPPPFRVSMMRQFGLGKMCFRGLDKKVGVYR